MDTAEIARIAESLRGTHHRRHNVDTIRQQLAPIIQAYKIIAIDEICPTWHRARRCDSGNPYSDLKSMIYPPKEKTGLGRCNLPGQPVLYCSRSVQTALEEIAAQPGDLVQTITLRIYQNNGFRCHSVGEYQSVYSCGASMIRSKTLEDGIRRHMGQTDSEEALLTQIYCDSFLAEAFRATAKRGHEYLPTAVFAETLHELGLCIVYPSVESVRGLNLVASPAQSATFFEVSETIVFPVQAYFGYGLYQLTKVASSRWFSADGTIDWNRSLGANATTDGDLTRASSGWKLPATNAAI